MKNVVLNDLYDYNDRKIYQLEEGFKFSLDSILLAEFCKIKSSKQIVVDFCSGNAVVPLILSTMYNNRIYGIEIQKVIYDLAIKSIEYNNLSDKITIINDNVLNSLKYFKKESVDIITCNPPYFKVKDSSYINNKNVKSIARHELEITLEQIICMAFQILKNNSYFYMVHRTDRLEEIILLFNKYNFKIKEIQFIYTKEESNANLVLIKALKNGNIGLKVNKPLYTNNMKTFQNIFKEN